MAVFKSVQRTNAAAVPRTLGKPNELAGRVRVAYFSYDAAGTEVAADTIELVDLPAGARVIQSFLAWTAGTLNTTISIGITGSVAKYMAAQTTSNVAGVKFGPTLVAEVDNLEESAAVTVIATLAVAGMPAAQKLRGYLLYVVD